MRAIRERLPWLRASRIFTSDVRFALGITLLLRIGLALWGAIIIIATGTTIIPNPPTMYHGLERVPDQGIWLLLAPWQRWDAIWYLRIAQFGYSSADPSASFFPIYSLLIRLVAASTIDFLAAALIVSTLATFIAFLLLYRLTAELFDPATAKRAVAYWAFFPTSFFLLAAYAESTLAAAALAALYFARQQRWWLVTIAAAATTLARPIGFLIAFPLAIEAWRARKQWSAWMPLVGVAVAMGAWMLYLQASFGDALLWMHAQAAWERVFVIPGEMIVWSLQSIFVQHDAIGNNTVDLVLTVFAIGAIVAAIRRLPASFSSYGLFLVCVPLLSFIQAPGYAAAPLASAGRRAMVVFPAFIALATVWYGKWRASVWVGAAAAAQLVLFTMFVLWLWVD